MSSLTQEQMREQYAPLISLGEECIDVILPSVWQVSEGYILKKFQIKGVQVEHLIPKEKKIETVIYHLHGGAYGIRYMDPYRDIALQYSKVAGDAEVISIDYDCAPSHLFPTALDESVAVYEWMLEEGYDAKNIVIIGDSAGGNLALVTTMYLRDHKIPLPKAIITFSPWTCLGTEFPSRVTNDEKDLLLGKDSPLMSRLVKEAPYGAEADKKSAYVSPVYGDYTGFPTMLVQCGGYEILLDEITEMANKAKAAGVDVTFSVYPELSHDFQLLIPNMEESRSAWKEIKEFFEKVSIKDTYTE